MNVKEKKKKIVFNKKHIKKLKIRTLILASESPRRLQILKSLGINPLIRKSGLNEEKIIKDFKNISPDKLVKILSIAKAFSVLHKYERCSLNGDEIIVAFDTIVVCRKKIISKPKNKKDAFHKIMFLSNKEHRVYSGIALLDLKKNLLSVNSDTTRVKMKKITKEEAIKYIKTKEPMDKAGAYAIQGKGKKFIKHIYGDYFNVVGLPLNKFLLMLSSHI